MSNLLCGWSIASIVVGVAIYWAAGQQDSASRKFAEAVASQFVIWGAIDLVFSIFGVMQARRADRTPIDDSAIASERADCDKLIRTLKFNGKLNWLWVASGVVLVASAFGAVWRHADPAAVGSLFGHGAGVLIQGGFLFWLDRHYLRQLARIGK